MIISMGQLICFFSISVPFHCSSIQLNRKGTGMEQNWNRNGAGMEQNWKGNGTGMEREWNWNGVGMERIGNGTEMEQKFNGRTMKAQFRVPGLLYDCIQAGSP